MRSKPTPLKFLLVICTTALFFICTATLASNTEIVSKKNIFNITSKIFIDGKLVSSPQIITKANSFAAIDIGDKDRKEELHISLIANDASNHEIKLNYKINYRDAINSLNSKQEVVVTPNKEETLSLASNSGHTYEMRVLARRE